MKTLCFLIFIAMSTPLYAANCGRNGQSIADEGWSPIVRRVCFTESISQNVFTSPDLTRRLLADKSGFSLFANGKRIPWPSGMNLDTNGSEISWSPDSSAFFISDGGGSGLDGWTLHVFSVSGSQLIERHDVNERIVQLFRSQINCSKAAADPNVRGLGWSKNAMSLLALAQSTVSEPCGVQGEFRGFEVIVATGVVSRVFSENVVKTHWHNLLPFNMR